MNRSGIIFSIILSIVLIGGAIAIRTTRPTLSRDNAITTAGENVAAYEDLFTEPGLATTTPETLTEVDWAGRQLLSDYLELKSTGQTTPENLRALAGQYAANFLQESSSALITQSQIKIISDTDENLQAYGEQIANLRAKHRSATGLSGYNNEYSDVFSDDFIKMMVLISVQYKLAAEEILALGVPSSLAENHLSLINNYMSSSERLKSIAFIGEDPVSALSAMSEQSKNGEIEEGLIANIKVRLMSRGLPHNL